MTPLTLVDLGLASEPLKTDLDLVGGLRGRVRHSLVVSPERVGRLGLSLYVMSDCYLGLDQQFALPLLVEEAGEEIFYSDEE